MPQQTLIIHSAAQCNYSCAHLLLGAFHCASHSLRKAHTRKMHYTLPQCIYGSTYKAHFVLLEMASGLVTCCEYILSSTVFRI
jgi:hypothetical protein